MLARHPEHPPFRSAKTNLLHRWPPCHRAAGEKISHSSVKYFHCWIPNPKPQTPNPKPGKSKTPPGSSKQYSTLSLPCSLRLLPPRGCIPPRSPLQSRYPPGPSKLASAAPLSRPGFRVEGLGFRAHPGSPQLLLCQDQGLGFRV